MLGPRRLRGERGGAGRLLSRCAACPIFVGCLPSAPPAPSPRPPSGGGGGWLEGGASCGLFVKFWRCGFVRCRRASRARAATRVRRMCRARGARALPVGRAAQRRAYAAPHSAPATHGGAPLSLARRVACGRSQMNGRGHELSVHLCMCRPCVGVLCLVFGGIVADAVYVFLRVEGVRAWSCAPARARARCARRVAWPPPRHAGGVGRTATSRRLGEPSSSA